MSKKAQVIRIDEYGSSEVMRFVEIDLPEPKAGEVQIQQYAVGINYLDTYNREGVFPVPELPWGLGVEGAGVIVDVGEGVENFSIGDRVTYASRPIGSYASLRNIPANYLIHLPDSISFETAAAITLQGLTAHMLTEYVTHLDESDTVLVHAAAGGLGLILVQWLKHRGCQVIGTVGSAEKAELAKSYGCDHLILYKEQSFVDEVKKITDDKGVSAVFEGLGGDIFHKSLNILKPFGHIVNLGQVSEGLPSIDLNQLGPVNSLTVSVPGVFAYIHNHKDLQGAANKLFDMVEKGHIKVHVNHKFPLSKVKEAHDALEQRLTVGSVILVP